MFDLERFTADCRGALTADRSIKHVREVVARAVADPGPLLRALGEPKCAGLHKLYQSHDLTILNVVWAPMMTIMPHNHSMWAVIGIYTGREDNIFWRRLPGTPGESRGGRRQGVVRGGCRTSPSRHHSFSYQSDLPPDRSDSCLRR